MALLEEVFSRMKQGRGRVVFVSGEAGIGKTRLVSEFRRRVEGAGTPFLTGTCYEQGQNTPYYPWIDVLRLAARKVPPETLKTLHPRILREIGKLVPQIISEAKDLGIKGWIAGPERTTTSGVFPSADEDRMRMFQSISEFVFAAAQSKGGMVLFLDDLLWADEASLQLFHHIGRRIANDPALLIATYRDDGLDEDHPLQKVILDLHKQRISDHLSITHFTPDYVSKLIQGQVSLESGGNVSSSATQLIFERTGGNPYFVEEIVQRLLELNAFVKAGDSWTLTDVGRIEIPSSVRAIVKQRVEGLDSKPKEVLSISSVLGMEFEYEVLAEVAGLGEEELISVLEGLLRARLVREQKTEHRVYYVFSDEQVREYLFDQVSSIRKRRYHSMIAKAIEKVHQKDIGAHLEAVAYHYVEADEIPKALEYSIKAGERAASVYAYHEAEKHFTNALELASAEDGETRLTLLSKLGEICFRRQEKRTENYLLEAIGIAKELGKIEIAAALYERLGGYYFFAASEKEKALDACMNGLELLKQTPATYQEAALYQQIGRIHALTGKQPEGLSWVNKAIEICERNGYRDILAHAYLTRAIVNPIQQADVSLSDLEKALAFALETKNEDAACRAYNNTADFWSSTMAEYTKGKSVFLEGIDYCRKVGFYAYETYVESEYVFDCLLPMGEWDALQKITDKYLVEKREIGELASLYHKIAFGEVALARGDRARARQLAKEAVEGAQRAGWTQFIVASHCLAGKLAAAEGKLGLAKENFLEALASADQEIVAELFPFRVEIRSFLAKVEIEQGNLVQAKHMAEESERVATTFVNEWVRNFSFSALGSVAAAESHYDEAIDSFEKAADGWRRVGRPYYLALELSDLSHAQRKAKQVDAADKTEAEARELFARLGVKKA